MKLKVTMLKILDPCTRCLPAIEVVLRHTLGEFSVLDCVIAALPTRKAIMYSTRSHDDIATLTILTDWTFGILETGSGF